MQGKSRKTLIETLEKMIESESSKEPETVKVVFVRNTKHNRKIFQAGQQVELSKEDFDVLTEAKVIQRIDD